MNQQDYIAVFDSGVGGVSVLRELQKLMPHENFYYYGDSANAPYGTKSTVEVRNLVMEAADYLFSKNTKCLVVACNTATAVAIDALRCANPEKIIIGIEPAFKLAADRYPNGTIGVMATDITLREEKLHHLINAYHHNCKVVPLPSPGVVELVEAGKSDSSEAVKLMQQELSSYRNKLDALVLGCTHYPFMKKAIRIALGDNVALIDGGLGTARETMRRLKEKNLLNQKGSGSLIIENSSADPGMISLTQKLLLL